MAFKGDYANFSQECQDTVDAINAAGGNAEYIQLDDPSYGGKFSGVTHLMMQGTDNLEVFDEILKWTTANIDNPMIAEACPSGPPPHKVDGKGHGKHHGKPHGKDLGQFFKKYLGFLKSKLHQ